MQSVFGAVCLEMMGNQCCHDFFIDAMQMLVELSLPTTPWSFLASALHQEDPSRFIERV